MRKLLISCVLILLCSGCASVPMGDTTKDFAYKAFSVSPGKSGLYVYRNESFGAAVHMEVAVDGKDIGQTIAKTYLYTDLPPGKHVITSKAENDDSIILDILPGHLYYVWQEVKLGILYARTKLHEVAESDGQMGVKECKLALTSSP